MIRFSRQRGFALILVLWVLVLLTGIGLAFSSLVRTDTRAAASLTDQVRLKAAADAALMQGIAQLLDAQRARTPIAWGTPQQIDWPDTRLRVTLRTESAKIDLNYAPAPLLTGLIRQVLPEAPAEQLTDAILDWRDRDQRRSPQGAEAADYLAAGRTITPANAPFTQVDELALVMGFDHASAAALAPYVTVFGRRPRVDPFSADAVVLAAVPGISPDVAEGFVQYRDAQLAAGDPVQLNALGAGTRYLERRPVIGAVRLQAEAISPAGRTLQREAVVRAGGVRGQRYQLLDWRQTTPEAG